jgi:hypothetical protein
MYNGVSLKDEIQQYLKDTFEKIDYPSKVGYFVGQFLWHPDHFLKNHMSTIKPRGNKVNDASRNDIPAEEKQLFLGSFNLIICIPLFLFRNYALLRWLSYPQIPKWRRKKIGT